MSILEYFPIALAALGFVLRFYLHSPAGSRNEATASAAAANTTIKATKPEPVSKRTPGKDGRREHNGSLALPSVG